MSNFSPGGRGIYNEEHLVQELKKECFDECGNEINLKKSAVIFQKLGRIYRSRSPNKQDLIKSAALFNASLMRSAEEEQENIEFDLKKLCQHIKDLAQVEDKDADLIQLAKDVKEKAILMRSKVKERIPTIPQITDTFDVKDVTAFEIDKTENIIKIQNQISQDYIDIMATFAEYCEKIMRKPPCKYAVVGLGSLARKEVTPYSDFEHCILLEKGDEEMLNHFRWFSVIFHVAVINLKETIIPSVAISSLNNYTKKDGDWFYDAVTERGICFDGMMPAACKFPLGRQKTENRPWTTELIKTVEEMAKYLLPKEDERNGYELASILLKPCFVYGEKSIYEAFQNESVMILKDVSRMKILSSIRTQVRADLNIAEISKTFSNLATKKRFNIKRLIYRSSTLFVALLGQLHGINASTNFSIIEKLFDKKIISMQTKQKLSYIIALACEIRLKWYMRKERQTDLIDPEIDKQNPIDALIGMVGKRSLCCYFLITFALQKEVVTISELECLPINQSEGESLIFKLSNGNRSSFPAFLKELDDI